MASIVTQSDQNGPKRVQNGSKRGSKRGPKGGPKMGPPEVGTKKKSENIIFFSGTSRPKKSPMCLFLVDWGQRKNIFRLFFGSDLWGTHFGTPFGTPFGTRFGHFGPILDHFGPILDHFGHFG